MCFPRGFCAVPGICAVSVFPRAAVRRALLRSGISVGREHIAALINTLALAYAGSSLPLLLLFFLNTDMPAWVIVNSDFLAEEIVRMLAGSAALLLAVPVATALAARAFASAYPAEATGLPGNRHHVH